MNPSPSRDQELLNIARGAETWPIAGVQKSHDARKGCSVVRSVGLGEHLLMQGPASHRSRTGQLPSHARVSPQCHCATELPLISLSDYCPLSVYLLPCRRMCANGTSVGGGWSCADVVVVRTPRKLGFDAQRADGAARSRGWVGCKLLVQDSRRTGQTARHGAHLGRPLGADKGGRASRCRRRWRCRCRAHSCHRSLVRGNLGQV
ncbi:hypothetical protein F5882DRAFT_388186 [Hyaloscypha sp. PMI_1271]|nr:hypothetical protein F5882DRAFT_388186 [Hyaloscypha sp. PMI_1271]